MSELIFTKRQVDELVESAERERQRRAKDMPDDAAAIKAMWRAHYRLRELGWQEAIYAPADGTHFEVVEPGSTGIHRAYRDSERRFWIIDGDTWPAHPTHWRPLSENVKPDDLGKVSEQ